MVVPVHWTCPSKQNLISTLHFASDSDVVLAANSLRLIDSWHLDVIKIACVEPICWQLDSFCGRAFLSQDLQNPARCTLGLLCYTSTLDIRDIMFTVSLHICQMCKCPFFIAFCKHVFLRSNILKQDKVTTIDVFIIRKMWVVFAYVILPATMQRCMC